MKQFHNNRGCLMKTTSLFIIYIIYYSHQWSEVLLSPGNQTKGLNVIIPIIIILFFFTLFDSESEKLLEEDRLPFAGHNHLTLLSRGRMLVS